MLSYLRILHGGHLVYRRMRWYVHVTQTVRIPSIKFHENRPMAAALIHADRRTNMATLIGAFSDYVNVPKRQTIWIQSADTFGIGNVCAFIKLETGVTLKQKEVSLLLRACACVTVVAIIHKKIKMSYWNSGSTFRMIFWCAVWGKGKGKGKGKVQRRTDHEGPEGS